MTTTCLACSFTRLNLVHADADVVVTAVLAYAWAHEQTIEQLCRGLCLAHQEMFKAGVLRAGVLPRKREETGR